MKRRIIAHTTELVTYGIWCFVYFDESRGSDMKLLSNAVALLTLEPKMTKDKFLQDVRMRKCERMVSR
jgi:hypothetical protein